MMCRTSGFLLLGLAAAVAGCSQAPPESPAEVAVVQTVVAPAGVEDTLWRSAPVHAAPLIVQDMVEPRLAQPSTPLVRVQAASDGSRLTMRLEWDDPTRDDLPGVARFADACAIQFPTAPGPDLPAPQMGEEGREVQIVYWSAAWQSAVDGRPDRIQELYPGAVTDHYPFDAAALPPGSPEQKRMADLYSPARSLGNRMAGPRERAVQDLLASGPGTLTPAAAQVAGGQGTWRDGAWVVLLSRPLPEVVGRSAGSQVAFAVWEGSRNETGSRKMRSAWIPIRILEKR